MTQYFNMQAAQSLMKTLVFSMALLFGGLGVSKAKTIIAERLDGGHFQDANDLQKRVRGIGMKSVEKMVDNGLTIESPSSFREPNGKTKKEGSSRRGARGQSGARPQQERAGSGRRN